MSYQPLASQEDAPFLNKIDGFEYSTWVQKIRGFILKYRGQLVVLFIGLIALAELGVIFRRSLVCFKCKEQRWNLLYSPASEAIQYEIRTFYGDAGKDTSPFWGSPSPELDQRWKSLSSHAVSKIPKYQAALLPNKTSPIPGDEEHYVAGLDVFHQLHCLNMIRQALHPDYYPERRMNTTYGDWHIRHCIDSVRQSLVCSSDISVIVWQWNEEFQTNTPKGNVAHTCRNYEKIVEWAKEREFDFKRHFNYKVHVKDDIIVPTYHTTQ